MSSLSGNFDMFIVGWCLIKRSLQTLETKNNYTFTQRWSGWRGKQINHPKSKPKRQKNSLFSSLVISAAVQKVVWIVAKRLKKCTKRLFEHFLFWWPLVFALVRVFPNPEIHLQRIRGKNGKKRGTGSFLGTHKGDTQRYLLYVFRWTRNIAKVRKVVLLGE